MRELPLFEFTRRLAYEDEYFRGEDQDSALGVALDSLMARLSEDERNVLELRLYGRYTYAEISRELGWGDGSSRDGGRKRAWRVERKALKLLRVLLEDRAWLMSLAANQEVFR